MAAMQESYNPYQTMSIASFGDSTLGKPERKHFATKDTMNVSDIEGARTKHRFPHTNKPPMLQSDVPGSTSKVLCRGRNCRDNSLYIDDIEGTRHSVKDRMLRSGRHVNPLVPEYPLPSYGQMEYPVNKFIRDTMKHDDIEGSTVQAKAPYATRDTISCADIVGAQADWKPRHARARLEREPHDIMSNVMADKKAPKFADRTTRHTDVMNPQYRVNGMEYKDGPQAKPAKPKAEIKDNHLLKTSDIPGATAGWKPDAIVRREYRNTNYIGDIEGSQADSIRPGITTKRETHPMAPVYQALDKGELLLPLIPPLLPPSMVKIPTIPRGSPGKPAVDSSSAGAGGIASFTQDQKSNAAAVNTYANYDDDPVLFTSDSKPGSAGPTSSTNTNSALNLDLGKTAPNRGPSPRGHVDKLQPSSRGFNYGAATGGGGGGSASGQNSGRGGVGYNSGRGGDNTNTLKQAGASATGGGYGGYSPAASGRKNSSGGGGSSMPGSGRLTPAQTRSARERQEEINLVKQLGM